MLDLDTIGYFLFMEEQERKEKEKDQEQEEVRQEEKEEEKELFLAGHAADVCVCSEVGLAAFFRRF